MAWDRKTNHRKLTGRPWRRLREQVMQRDKYLCQCDECKAALAPMLADEVDHIVPLAHGGTDDMSNLRAMSKEHHERKTLRDSGVKVRLSRAERRAQQGDHWSR